MNPSPSRTPARILITGGAGFIGSHLASTLLDHGHHVSVIDDLSTGRFENIAGLASHPRFSYTHDTILNPPVLERLAGGSDLIFHLAAAVGVKLIVDRPVHTIETNVRGTEAVLEAARRAGVKVLLASSSEVYGKSLQAPFREGDDVVLGPTIRSRWSYAASKMLSEFLALAYAREQSLPVVIFRLFNTVGPRQTGRYGMVIPRFVEQALNSEPLTVYGDGAQTRCFLHVEDAVQALLGLAAAPGAVGGVFNVGSEEEVSILDLARTVLRLVRARRHDFPRRHDFTRRLDFEKRPGLKSGEEILFVPYDQAYAEGFDDMRRRVPDISKIKSLTGWAPRRHLQEILEDVIDYFIKQR